MNKKNAYLFGRGLYRSAPWTPAEVERICLRARAAAPALAAAPQDYILDTLDAVGRFCGDRRGAWYKEAYREMKAYSGFSGETVGLLLDSLPRMFSRAETEKRLRLELGLPGVLDGCVERDGYAGQVTASPRGAVLHVGAGNVFIGVLDSLLMGLLTRNAAVVKAASGGEAGVVHFLGALKRCDRRGLLARSVAALGWPGGERAVELAAARSVDAVVAWGGEQAVAAWRAAAPSTTHVAAFGPKMSLAVVLPSALAAEGAAAVAEKIARDAAFCEQQACASPQNVFIVDPALRARDPLAKEFRLALAAGFRKAAKEIPPGPLSFDEQAELTRARGLAKIDAATGAAALESAYPSTDWTVIAEKDARFRPSPLNRALYVKCVSSISEVEKAVAARRGLVQTVGVAGTLAERRELARRLSPLGVARVTRAGAMLEAPAGSPHDGTFPMRELVRFTGVEGEPSAADRLGELVEHARKNSPFYRKFYKGLAPVASPADFLKVPLLTKEHVLANTPPDSEAMFTAPVRGGIYFASGGSTGSPKYIFFEAREHDRVSRTFAASMLSAGLTAEDRVANLFVSGNLWSSWLGVERALALTPAISVPVGSALPLPNIAAYLRDFRVTVIVGLPSFLVKLAEFIKESGGKYRFPLKTILYGGEYAGPEMVRFFRGVFPGVTVRSVAYASVDAGIIGYQCPHCPGAVHHVFESEQHLEILDTVSGKPVGPGEIGELTTTVLHKRHMPIIRFRVGDLGRWLEGPCPCGSADRRFEILGRCDDRIHVGGAHLFVSDIQAAVAKVPDLGFGFQAVIDKKGHKDALTIRAEVRDPAALARSGELGDLLWREVLKHCEDLHESVRLRWLDKPEIEVLAPGAIERVQRTGKLRRVLDRRTKV